MALEPCRECGEQVSTQAKTCPHCGAGEPTGGSFISGALKGVGVGCLILPVLFIMCAWGANRRSAPAPSYSSTPVPSTSSTVTTSQLMIWCETAIGDSIARRAPGATWRWQDDKVTRYPRAGEAIISGSLHVIPKGANTIALRSGKRARAAVRMQYVCGSSSAEGRASVMFIVDKSMGGGRLLLDSTP